MYDIGYQGAISLEPLPKGASPYEAREGIISKEKLDSDLKYALTYLKREQEFVMGYICAEGKTKWIFKDTYILISKKFLRKLMRAEEKGGDFS